MEQEENGKIRDDVDWDGFLGRMHLKKAETARLIGAAPAMITDWMSGKSQPSRKYLKKLGMIGMTAQEMFGEEAGNELVKNSMDTEQNAAKLDSFVKSKEFRDSVEKILIEINSGGHKQ